MFKKIALSIFTVSALLAISPAEAKFGAPKPVKMVQQSAPSKAPSTFVAQPSVAKKQQSGGLSGGQSIGMSRKDLAQDVRNGNVTSKNNGNYAGNGGGNNGSNGGNNGGGYYDPRSYQPRYQPQYQVQNGHSTSTVVGAAVAGAVAGAALDHALSNNHPTTTIINNGSGSTMPSGGVYYDNGSNMPQQSQTYSNQIPNNSSGGMGFFGFLFSMIILAVLAYVIYRVFASNTSTSNGEQAMSTFVPNIKSKKTILENEMDQIFIQFQKHNNPNGLSYIQENTDAPIFEVLRSSIEANESNFVQVKSFQSQLVDYSHQGDLPIASVLYEAVIVEKDNGQLVDVPVKELWNFVYKENKWLLAGIDQV